jgi:NAD(P)H-dependent FMN reductase
MQKDIEKLHITIVLGTARDGRLSEKVAHEIERHINEREGNEATFIDVRDFVFGKTEPGWEESEIAEPWRRTVRNTDGFVFVVPEYNRSFPGELKLLLDAESPKNYAKRAITLVGVSSGQFGGSRAIMSLQPVVSELGLVYTNRPFLVQEVATLFDSNDQLINERREAFEGLLFATLDELEWYARLLKGGRAELK